VENSPLPSLDVLVVIPGRAKK
jgi:hypothetical protein